MSDQEKDKLLQQLKDALVAIRKLKSDLKETREAQSEPIAIIGMSMRFPGKVNNAEDFWKLLSDGTDAMTDIPSDRFDVEALYDPTPGTRGKINVRQGGFIEHVDEFDGSFFDITPVELESTDPQQRILLELTHEALEHAGQDVKALVGSNTGVYVGISCNDYTSMHFRSGDYDLVGPYAYTGAAVSASSGRLSYMMGFQGPSITLDTACSATIVTAHLATSALRNRECNMAVVGGANLILGPEMHICFSNLNALSPDSRCKTFDNSANGYVRSEGSAVMILKRLSDARRDGDRVLAVIKGSAINQDGRSNGFTAPNVAAQVQVIERALENAQLSPEAVRYIEAHGTGTKIGDPIEVEALSRVFSAARSQQSPLLVGSVKSNIGHLESTAGMASILKAVLCLQHGKVPPSIHVKQPNELIHWPSIPVSVVTAMTDLPGEDPCIGISGFGITGTNGHIILGKAPETDVAAPAAGSLADNILVLPLSARSPEALQAQAAQYANFLEATSHTAAEVCAFAALKRAHLELRKTFVSESKAGLVEQLRTYAEHGGPASRKFDAEDAVQIAFVFSGQGAQWAGMGRELLKHSPEFREAIEACNAAFRPHVEWDLLEELAKDEKDTRLGEGDVMQPILFAIGVATAKWWLAKGVHPDVVLGHSMGEIAAAHIAGHIGLEEAALIVCTRSRLMEAQAGKGAMGATDLSVSEARERVKAYDGKLTVAVMNSPSITVIGGDPEALDAFFAELEKEGRFCKRVRMTVAAHTPQMDPVLEPLREALSGLQPVSKNIDFYSTSQNKFVDGNALNADYWVGNVRQPVQFGASIAQLVKEGPTVLIEIGPHTVLSAAMEEVALAEGMQRSTLVTGSFYRSKAEWPDIHANWCKLYEAGLDLDWTKLYAHIGAFVDLPTYPWQRERYWFDEVPKNIQRAASAGAKAADAGPFYQYVWSELQPATNPKAFKKMLIVSAGDGTSEALSSGLSTDMVDVEVTRPGQFALALEDEHFDRIIFLSTGHEALSDQIERCIALQKVVQQLSESSLEHIPQVCLLTKDAFPGMNPLNVEGAMLWGMMRTLRNEHPEIRPLCIDTEELDAPGVIALLQADHDHTLEFRVREGYTEHPQLLPVKQGKDVSEEEDACYLVTGGTSGLGLAFAEYLAEKGVGKLALISRSGAKKETAGAIERMQAAGASVEVLAADASNTASLEEAVRQIGERLGTITGVVHAAGLLDDGMALNLTAEQFHSVCQPKVTATQVLHQVLKPLGLKRFIACSSAAHLLGNPGQANYNAANNAMDQLVATMALEGINATSVNWGNIGGSGMAATDALRGERLASMGVAPISPAELPTYFDRIYHTAEPQIVAAKIDFPTWAQQHPATLQNAAYRGLLGEAKTAAVTGERRWGDQPADALRKLKEMLRQHVSGVTGIPIAKLREDDTFKSMGIDSMMALQVRNKIQDSTSLPLPVSSIWAHPTIGKYAAFLLEELELPESGEDAKGEREWSAKQLKDLLRESVTQVTKLPAGKIRETDTFKSMGVDSMQALQIRNLLQSGIGIALPVSTIWAHPTIEKYVLFLQESLAPAASSQETSPAKAAEEIREEVEDLSLEELMKQLEDKSKDH